MIVRLSVLLLVTVGTLLLLSAALALIRFEGPYMKIHASSKASCGGSLVILAMLFIEGYSQSIGLILLTSIFLLLTSPVVGHSLGRAAYQDGIMTDSIDEIEYEGEDSC